MSVAFVMYSLYKIIGHVPLIVYLKKCSINHQFCIIAFASNLVVVKNNLIQKIHDC